MRWQAVGRFLIIGDRLLKNNGFIFIWTLNLWLGCGTICHHFALTAVIKGIKLL